MKKKVRGREGEKRREKRREEEKVGGEERHREREVQRKRAKGKERGERETKQVEKKRERERENSAALEVKRGFPAGPACLSGPLSLSHFSHRSTPPLIKVCVSNRTGWSKTTSPMKCLAFLLGSCFSPLPELCSGIDINNVKAHIWGVGSKQLRPLGVEGHFTQV